MPSIKTPIASFRCMLASVAILLLMILLCRMYAAGVNLTVVSNVGGTHVQVDTRGGNLPEDTQRIVFTKVPYGARKVEVLHPDYEPYAMVHTISWLSFHPKVEAQLKPRQVFLTVRTVPGAQIAINGTMVGQAGEDGVFIKQDAVAGHHRITVKRSGYEEWNAEEHLTSPRHIIWANLRISEQKIREIESNRAKSLQYVLDGRKLFGQRNYQGALTALNAALALDPESREARSLRDQVEQTIRILGGR